MRDQLKRWRLIDVYIISEKENTNIDREPVKKQMNKEKGKTNDNTINTIWT